MLPADRIRLQHMADAVESAQRFSAGRKQADFDTDDMLLFATIRAIEIVGEAGSRISEELRIANPQVPSAQISGMRNRLVHAYFDVDTRVVWATVSQALPKLLVQLKTLLQQQ
jgi:uncharacterized protein with HEPN domain